MSQLLELSIVAGSAAIAGGAAFWGWTRFAHYWRTHVSPAVPSAMLNGSATSSSLPSPVPSPIEIHLVLNVLNRMGMALGQDEHAQDGVASLGEYLSALNMMKRQPLTAGPKVMAASAEAYRRLSEWQHGTQRADFKWTSYGTLNDPLATDRILDAIQGALRQIEAEEIDEIHVAVVTPVDAAEHALKPEGVVELTIRKSRPNFTGVQQQKGWRVSGNGAWVLQRRVPL